jgi:hypothetical protein
MINQETISIFCRQLGAADENDKILKSLINYRHIRDFILYERAGNLSNEDAEYFIIGMHLNVTNAHEHGLRTASTQKAIKQIRKAKTVKQLVEFYVNQGKLAEKYFIKEH